MSVQIYNTLTKKKDSLPEGNIKMYTCGVTVYDVCHIGHARSLYIFDVIVRYLKYRGYKVKFVRNITDIDDKIINKAKELNLSAKEVAEKHTKGYYEDLKSLGIGKADFEPKATENIPDMIKHIQGLIKKGYAYVLDGDVYFSVRKFKDYGKLSGQNLEQMMSGARIEKDERKQDPLDFALWKKSKEGEPSWKSPWGEGRPGWHIECSVMSLKYLKTQTLDIHAGGLDLVFPHHENEIAQAEALTGKPFAKHWIHHGLLTINGQKMAKSLGNFVTIQDALKDNLADVLKMFYLQSHYASPIDYSAKKIEEAKDQYVSFVRLNDKEALNKIGDLKISSQDKKEIDKYRFSFEEAMDNDFNTPEALKYLRQLKSYAFSYKANLAKFKYAIDVITDLLNIFALSPDKADLQDIKLATKNGLREAIGEAFEDTKSIQKDVDERIKLKKEKKYGEADKIREKLEKKGIILEDLKDGTTSWRWK